MMDYKEIISLLKNRANDPHTTVYDLRAIAIAALVTIQDAELNLQTAIEKEEEEYNSTISVDIMYSIQDAVRYGVGELGELAKKLRDEE